MRAAAQPMTKTSGNTQADHAAAARAVQRLLHGVGGGIAAAAADRGAFAGAGDASLECETDHHQDERLKQDLSQSVAKRDPTFRFYR
jgi:hypothetical protein